MQILVEEECLQWQLECRLSAVGVSHAVDFCAAFFFFFLFFFFIFCLAVSGLWCASRVWSGHLHRTLFLGDASQSQWTCRYTGLAVHRRATLSHAARKTRLTQHVNAGGTSLLAGASTPPFRYCTIRYFSFCACGISRFKRESNGPTTYQNSLFSIALLSCKLQMRGVL